MREGLHLPAHGPTAGDARPRLAVVVDGGNEVADAAGVLHRLLPSRSARCCQLTARWVRQRDQARVKALESRSDNGAHSPGFTDAPHDDATPRDRKARAQRGQRRARRALDLSPPSGFAVSSTRAWQTAEGDRLPVGCHDAGECACHMRPAVSGAERWLACRLKRSTSTPLTSKASAYWRPADAPFSPAAGASASLS